MEYNSYDKIHGRMTILTHAAIGGLVGMYSPNIYVSSLLGFLSHFIFDFVPHNDYLYFFLEKRENPYTSWTSRIILVLTLIYLTSLFLFLPRELALRTLLGSLSAMIPDVLTGAWRTLNWPPSRFDKIHHLTHLRLTVAERLHNQTHSENKISKKDRLPLSFEKMKSSQPARIGWGLELLGELLLLIFCLIGLGIVA